MVRICKKKINTNILLLDIFNKSAHQVWHISFEIFDWFLKKTRVKKKRNVKWKVENSCNLTKPCYYLIFRYIVYFLGRQAVLWRQAKNKNLTRLVNKTTAYPCVYFNFIGLDTEFFFFANFSIFLIEFSYIKPEIVNNGNYMFFHNKTPKVLLRWLVFKVDKKYVKI